MSYGQRELELYTLRMRIDPKFVCCVVDSIICEQSEVGGSWSSHGSVDHPTFARLRTYLEKKGYISTCRVSSNGDRTLKPFYLNDVKFNEGDRFFCGAAMHSHLERSEKEPMKVVEIKEAPYDAELRNWQLVKSYHYDCTVVTGEIYGDLKNRFRDGDKITTSEVKGIEGTRLITRNTVYKLA